MTEDPVVVEWIRDKVRKVWVDEYVWSKPSLAAVRHERGAVVLRPVGPHLRALLETDWTIDFSEKGFLPPTEGEWWVWEGVVELGATGLVAVGTFRQPLRSEWPAIRRGGVPWDDLDWCTPEVRRQFAEADGTLTAD